MYGQVTNVVTGPATGIMIDLKSEMMDPKDDYP